MKLCVACGHACQAAGWRCDMCGRSPQMIGRFPAFAPELSEANDAYPSEYFRTLVDREADHFWFQGRNRLILWAISRHVPADASFLELGCGTGFVLRGIRQRFPRMRLHGGDIYGEVLALAAARVPDASLCQMDGRCIPYQSEFDAIGAFDVIEHVQEDDEVLRRMWQAVKPGGAILLTVPQHPLLWSSVDEHAFHKRRYTARQLETRIREAGFEQIRLLSFMTLLLPLMVLRRLSSARNGRNAGCELEINPIINTVCSAVFSAEIAMIRSGLRLPVGSSLLAVARRPPRERR